MPDQWTFYDDFVNYMKRMAAYLKQSNRMVDDVILADVRFYSRHIADSDFASTTIVDADNFTPQNIMSAKMCIIPIFTGSHFFLVVSRRKSSTEIDLHLVDSLHG